MNTILNKAFLIVQVVVCLHYSLCFPLESDVSPCDLFMGEDDTDNTLFCDQKNTTLEQIKNALNTLKGEGTIELELYQVNLGVVPSDFFKGHNIKVLTIAYCDLHSLRGGGERILEGLEDTVESLMIKGSSLDGSEFQNSALSHLKKLEHIDFQQNNFEEIGNDWFKNAPASLKSVWLQNNNIKRLGDRAFADISNLDFLGLSGNSLRDVTRNMLPNPGNKLWRLELDDNKLTSLPEDIFSNMPKLERVSISSNSISELPENVWRPIWKQLTHVDLSDNPLDCDSLDDWISEESTCAKISGTCRFFHGTYRKKLPLKRDLNCY